MSIQEELDHLNDYFHIIRVRYENRIELRLNVAENVQLDWPMLKLSLQPIVENAIQHGILYKGGKGTVLVTLEVVKDMLSVTVYDDGAGISEVRLQELMQRLSEPKAPSKNVGMKNVHDRIKSVCGDEYGLFISSVEHVGTSVCLLLPITELPRKVIAHD